MTKNLRFAFMSAVLFAIILFTCAIPPSPFDQSPVIYYSPATAQALKGKQFQLLAPTFERYAKIDNYSIAPALPAGLSMGASTGTIDGIPTVFLPATKFVVTATNSFGSDTAGFELTVSLSKPDTLFASASDSTTVHLIWSKAFAADSFRVFRTRDILQGFAPVRTILDTLFTDSNLTPGLTYYYYVIGLSGATQSSASPTISVTTKVRNSAPVAIKDSFAIAEDSVLTIAAPGVLANDNDIDHDPLFAIRTDSTKHGSLTLNSNGSFTYTPAANWNGIDTFAYSAKDVAAALSAPVKVIIVVNPVNDAPIGREDAYSTVFNTALHVATQNGVLKNDADIDNVLLGAVLVDSTKHGSIAFKSDGSFDYVPVTGYVGSDTFYYSAKDSLNATSPKTFVKISLTAVANQKPTAVRDAYSINEDNLLTVPKASGLLSNDTDPDSDILHIPAINDSTKHGKLLWNTDGSFTYKPDTNFCSLDSFSYMATDNISGTSGKAWAVITVTPVNDIPVIVRSSGASLAQGGTTVIDSAKLKITDADNSSAQITFTITKAPLHGTILINTTTVLSLREKQDYPA